MKKILTKIKDCFTLDVAIVIILAVFVLLKNDFFILHPYFIVLLTLCANYRFRTYVVFNLVTIMFSFIFSYQYGLLITFITSGFFFLKVIVNSFFNNRFIKDYAPFFIISLIFDIYLISLDTSLTNILKVIFNFSLSLIALYGFYPMVKNIKYKAKIPEKNRILSFCLFPLFFLGSDPFLILILQSLHIFYLKTLKHEESLIAMLLSSFLLYYLCKIDIIIIFSLIIPFLINWFFFNKHNLFTYALFFVIYEALFVQEFYINENFYQSLIAFILGIFISDQGYEKVHLFFYQEKKENNQKEKNVINDIKKYINYVLSPNLEDKDSPQEKVLNQFNYNLCSNCQKEKTCSLKTLQLKSISTKLNQQERGSVLNFCSSPYKFFKQSEIMRDIYQREYDKVNKTLELQNAYKKELSNIYTPLLLLEKEEISLPKKLKELLKDEELKILECAEYDDELEIRILHFDQDDLTRIKDIIYEVYQKMPSFIKSAYSFSSGCYILLFTFKAQYKIDYYYSNDGVNNKSGDYLKLITNDNKFIFLLSDGMGHSSYSASLSEFLVESLLAFKALNSDFAKQIQTVNNLLYNKSTQDAYATLDYLTIDLTTLQFNLFKAGSFPNYIFHKDKIKESKKNFPPLGILEEITPFAYQDYLEFNDILIFLTDGFKEEVKETIEMVLSCSSSLSAKEIHHQIKEALLQESLINDDKTLVVLKIEKRN